MLPALASKAKSGQKFFLPAVAPGIPHVVRAERVEAVLFRAAIGKIFGAITPASPHFLRRMA